MIRDYRCSTSTMAIVASGSRCGPLRATGRRPEHEQLARRTHDRRNLETIDGRPALRFERVLPHSVERVWRAVSVPAELERWFPAAADWTPATGEIFEAAGMTGEVTEVDPPHRLAWTFAGELYSFDLATHGDGCRLIFRAPRGGPDAGTALRGGPAFPSLMIR